MSHPTRPLGPSPSINDQPPRRYLTDANRDRALRNSEAAELAEAGLDAKQVALALAWALADGTITKTENDNGTSTVERVDGADLDLDALIEQYATTDDEELIADEAEDDGS